jgi:chemotaxis protein methyltransferase CheR
MMSARLARRLRKLQLPDFGAYITQLEAQSPSSPEVVEMINALTTNKTEFFRESHHFDFLVSDVIPQARERAVKGGPRRLHIWCAASSTGEEPYSIAMTLCEHLGPLGSWDVKILASDIDTRVLATAMEGIYSDDKVESVPEHLRRRYFQRGRNGAQGLWRVRPELRNMIDFQRINLNQPAPAGPQPRFDAIFCRNVIIYFDRPTQVKLFERLARQLDPAGYLFLGHSESLIGVSERYALVRQTVHRLRAPVPDSPLTVAPPPPPPRPRAPALPIKRIIVGEVFASREPMIVRTLLGSCVSSALYDPEARVGGLNHFLLPDGEGDDDGDRGARYGVHAMELLINELMKLGAARHRLVAKIFGGAHVMPGMSRAVPDENVQFVQAFLQREAIPVVGQRIAGTSALEVCFETTTGRAKVRALSSVPAALRAQQEAERARLREVSRNFDSRVTLF